MQPDPLVAGALARGEALSAETIVAISTPPGRGGIGIVRLSGPLAQTIAAPLLRLRAPLSHAQARFGEVLSVEIPEEGPRLDEARLDEAIVTLFAAPNSYTGEDVVEIAAHGSPVVLDLLVRRAMAGGARLARPGEFTERAFLSGRIDLTQAEAVRDLIEAQTLYQARVATEQMGGALSARVQPIKEDLVALITLLEAGIDFAEDDVEITPEAEISARILILETALAPVVASFDEGRLVHAGLTLAIVGRPNAGKSSLFNRLIERERAIVTAVPGTTRDLVTETVSIGGIPVQLVDTAGLRETEDEVEAIGIRKTHTAMADADVVLVVLDAGVAVEGNGLQGNELRLSAQETELLAGLAARRSIAVLNKVDLLPAGWDRTQLTAAGKSVAGKSGAGKSGAGSLVATSAQTGEGVAELRGEILRLVRGPGAEASSGMLTSLRHYEAVAGCLESLAKARESIPLHTPHEMLLLDLYAALKQLDSLTGETTADDILNRIFSTFCIGK